MCVYIHIYIHTHTQRFLDKNLNIVVGKFQFSGKIALKSNECINIFILSIFIQYIVIQYIHSIYITL